jgi:hypothetical protein
MEASTLEKYSSELMILLLSALVLGTVLYLVPQLLRVYNRQIECSHAERMRALEQNQPPYHPDDRIRGAGRTAALVPMVVVCAASTVTCFQTVCRSESLFSVTLAVWAVAGLISLASITGGVALMGRLAHLDAGLPDESHEPPSEPQDRDKEEYSDAV